MRFFSHPFAVRHQDHSQAIPAREEAAQAHHPCAAVRVVRVDEPDRIEGEIDQDDDMAPDAALHSSMLIGPSSRSQADCRS
ncbi:MAG TPA: hypothetical protein VE999_11770 [Gemmataceae bacterium]|nr:hypothetical protein [Gemmataceae bacterium]